MAAGLSSSAAAPETTAALRRAAPEEEPPSTVALEPNVSSMNEPGSRSDTMCVPGATDRDCACRHPHS